MPRIWCAISGHGFGHAAQVVPVLNELRKRIPHCRVLLRTTVPRKFFAHRLVVPWELSVQEQDVGCVQHDPLTIDVTATWRAYQQFYDSFESRVCEECEALKQHGPDLVLSNISYLALEAGRRVGVPTIALGSLSWDQVLQGFVNPQDPTHGQLITHIQDIYKRTEFAIRMAPSLSMDSFPRHYDVGPIVNHTATNQEVGQKTIPKDSADPVVLVALGGVPLSSLPFERLNQFSSYRFLLDVPLSTRYARVKSTHDGSRNFTDLFAEANIIVSKPGYGTVVEAVAAQKPLVYVRRYNFPDEGPLVEYLHRYGRAVEMTKADFDSGMWCEALEAVQLTPAPREDPPASGVKAAADIIGGYLKKKA